MRRDKRQDGIVVAVGSCNLASLTDRHASVEALNSVYEFANMYSYEYRVNE
jgi:hypothetical protein